jgi:hypothetical protein
MTVLISEDTSRDAVNIFIPHEIINISGNTYQDEDTLRSNTASERDC